MEHADHEILYALEGTHVVRPPRQRLASFGNTVFKYHLVTRPTYESPGDRQAEAVVRDGTVTAQRPAIVTPAYLLNLEGFGAEARRSLEHLSGSYGADNPGLMYTYRNEATQLTIVNGSVEQVAGRIAADLDASHTDLVAVIVGVDRLWDVSLLKFIYEFTAASFLENIDEMQQHGLLRADPGAGVPRGAVRDIERLFQSVEMGDASPAVLKTELDRWDRFSLYEDRFFSLFRRNQ